MRAVRDAIDDAEGRSARLWSCVQDEPAVRTAGVVMAFESLPGEPATASFLEWCRQQGKVVVVPDARPSTPFPAEPRSIDAVIVPGLAFSRDGDRLGQGGGWYDRLLADLRDDCTSIGVAFEDQLVDDLPTEEHDVQVDMVITEAGRAMPR